MFFDNVGFISGLRFVVFDVEIFNENIINGD